MVPIDAWTTATPEEFDLASEDLTDLEIRVAKQGDRFFYFYHTKRRSLVKSFVLGRTPKTKQLCSVALIRNDERRFSPRFIFSTRDTSNKGIASVDVPVRDSETRTVKARVDLTDCHVNLWKLIGYLEALEEIDIPVSTFRVVAEQEAEITRALRGASRSQVLVAVKAAISGLTDQEVALLTDRKRSLGEFATFLRDPEAVEAARLRLGDKKRNEDVWQDFFQRNEWIFGYGLKLVSCEGLSGRVLETIVTGSDFLSGAGKRIDALMKTRGHISSLLFCEIKTPDAHLMAQSQYRPDVFVPDSELRGGVAQVQKTIHKVSLKVTQNHNELTGEGGSPTGETVTVVRPRGVVVVGRLSEFQEEHGLNFERFSSFELYRNSLSGLEVLTFDELYERATFIVEQFTASTDPVGLPNSQGQR